MLDRITVHGARQHNLKNIDVEIPRNALTVITGLSGSGKSSLAFDTIYAEGQRRNGHVALTAPAAGDDPAGELSFDELEAREREIVVTALRRTRGKIYGPDGAAALLRTKPTTLASKIKRLNVQKESA